MNKEKKYNIPNKEDDSNKVAEPVAEYRSSYIGDVRKDDFEHEWKRGITVDEFRLQLKAKLRLRYGR